MEQEWGCIKKLSAEEQERLEAEAIEKARKDYVTRIRAAEREGREKASKEIAIRMMRHNKSIEYISELTGLSFEQIYDIYSMDQECFEYNE